MHPLRRVHLVTLLAAALFLGACTGSPAPNAGSTSTPTASRDSGLIRVDDFAKAVAQPNRVTVNVHVPFEGAIPGTDLFIPFDKIEQQASRLPANRTTPLAIYCRTGSMSATAMKTLSTLGYTDVLELEGGMRAWRASGRSLTGR